MDKTLTSFLVVEDDEIDIMNMERAFRKLRILNPLFFARNVQDALAKLDNNELPEKLALIVDLNMSLYSGHELIERVRKLEGREGMPIFILTTSKMVSDIKEAWVQRVNGYFLKEMSQEDFSKTIQCIVEFVNRGIWKV